MKRKALLLITLCILLCGCEMKADVAKYRYTQDMDNNGLLNSVFYFIPATSNDIEENFTWLPDNNAMGVYWDNHIQIKLSDEENLKLKPRWTSLCQHIINCQAYFRIIITLLNYLS